MNQSTAERPQRHERNGIRTPMRQLITATTDHPQHQEPINCLQTSAPNGMNQPSVAIAARPLIHAPTHRCNNQAAQRLIESCGTLGECKLIAIIMWRHTQVEPNNECTCYAASMGNNDTMHQVEDE